MKPTLNNCALIVFLFFSPFFLTAQQLGFYSIYQKNWQIINPAAPSLAFIQTTDASKVLNISYRQQWIGLRGSPANYNINYEQMQVLSTEKLAPKFGFGLYGESAGALLNNTIYFNYSYPLSLGIGRQVVSDYKLFIGFNAGYYNRRINFNSIRFENGVDATVENIIKEQKLFSGQSFFELNPGLFFTDAENFYVGLSSPRLVTTGRSSGSLSAFNPRPEIHLIAGLNNRLLIVEPSIWLRWQSSLDYQSLIKKNPISATFNMKYKFPESLSLGLGVSTGRWIHFEGGWQMGYSSNPYSTSKPIQLTFGYDFPFYKSGLNLGQTAEINLTFFLY